MNTRHLCRPESFLLILINNVIFIHILPYAHTIEGLPYEPLLEGGMGD